MVRTKDLLKVKGMLINPAALLAKLEAGEDLQIVDVRNAYEYELGAIPGAVNIPVDELRHRLAELDPVRETVVYDRNGSTAYVAARQLAQQGFPVASLTGGFVLFPVAQMQRVSG